MYIHNLVHISNVYFYCELRNPMTAAAFKNVTHVFLARFSPHPLAEKLYPPLSRLILEMDEKLQCKGIFATHK